MYRIAWRESVRGSRRSNALVASLLLTASLPAGASLSTSPSQPVISPIQARESPLAIGVRTQSPPSFVRGRVLVQFKVGITPQQAASVLASLHSRSTGEIPDTDVHIVQLPPHASETAVAQILNRRPDVSFAEPDAIVPPADVIPNDPWYANWEPHLPQIHCPTAWMTTTGSSSVTIAILDTGVDGIHEDLVANMVPGWNFYDNNSNTSDVYGHGTRVAGTAAAGGNNGIGVASVAWNCKIMPVRISDVSGVTTYSMAASGLTWAADHGARVANLSYELTDSSTVTSAAQYFVSKGGVVTMAAGNESTFDPTADNPYVLTVSGVDVTDTLYSWSNTGNNVDVSAPGFVYTTVRGGGYSSGAGTSFAAPLVAGEAALVLSANQNLSGTQARDIIKSSADDLGPVGWDPTYGWGRINVASAVALALATVGTGGPDTMAPQVSFTSPTSGASVSGTISVQTSAGDSVGVASVTLAVDGVTVGTDTTSPYNFTWGTGSATNGSHALTATAKDSAGNSSTSQISVTVNNLADTVAPTVTIASPANGSSIPKTGTVTVSVRATDNVGVTKVQLYVDGSLTATSTSAPFTTAWNAKRAAAGAHTLVCKAYDAAGNVGVSPGIAVFR